MKFKKGDRVILKPPYNREKGIVVKVRHRSHYRPIEVNLDNDKANLNPYSFEIYELRKI